MDVSSGFSKVQIPRLQRPDDGKGKEKKARTAHACDQCRQRKTKCDSKRPTCSHCADFSIPCHYGAGKRERAKEELDDLKNKVELYQRALGRIEPFLNNAARSVLHESLGNMSPGDPVSGEPVGEQDAQTQATADSTPRTGPGSVGSESQESDDVVHNYDTAQPGKHMLEEINTLVITNPVGYMGKGSDMSMIHRLLNRLASDQRREAAPNPAEQGMYHLDDIDLTIPIGLDPFALPPRYIADTLLDAYFITLHQIFPIIHKPSFIEQYEKIYQFAQPPQSSSTKWLASFNLVLGIGKRYTEVTGILTDNVSNITYLMRARVLGALDGGVIFDVATLPDVQNLGLTGMFLLASKQTNRAWTVVGLALRLAHALGLHLPNDSASLNDKQNQERLRIWYSLCYLESVLFLINGRPPALRQGDLTVPRAAASGETTLGNGDDLPHLYYHNLINLTSIAMDVHQHLYSVHSMRSQNRVWSRAQKTIKSMNQRLKRWRDDLPEPLDFTIKEHPVSVGVFKRQRMDLSLRYYNVVALVSRPCLCLVDGVFQGETVEDHEFCRDSVRVCVRAAREILATACQSATTAPELGELPWWCILHYIVSAEAILMLEMVLRLAHDDIEIRTIFEESLDAIKWMRLLGTHDVAAQRCYIQLTNILNKVTQTGQPEEHRVPFQPSTLAGVSSLADFDMGGSDSIYRDRWWMWPAVGANLALQPPYPEQPGFESFQQYLHEDEEKSDLWFQQLPR